MAPKHKSKSFPLCSIYLYFGPCNVFLYLALIASSRKVSVSCPYLLLEGSARMAAKQSEILISHKNSSMSSSIWPQAPDRVTSMWSKVFTSEFLSVDLFSSYFIYFLHKYKKKGQKMRQFAIPFSLVTHAKAFQLSVPLTG